MRGPLRKCAVSPRFEKMFGYRARPGFAEHESVLTGWRSQAQITANRQSADQSERAYRRAGGSRSYLSTALNHIRCRYLRRDCAFSLSLTPDLSNASFRRCRSRNDLNSDINSGGSARAIFKSPYIRACSRSGKIERGYRRFPIVATPFEMELNVPETTCPA